MALDFNYENEHARLFPAWQFFSAAANYEINFKEDMSCLRTCKELAKELFDALMDHLRDYTMKAKFSVDIDYELRGNNGEVMKKTAHYTSSRAIQYLCKRNADEFYNYYMSVLVRRTKQYLYKDYVTITKIQRIIFEVNCLPASVQPSHYAISNRHS